jgi:nickel transport protein
MRLSHLLVLPGVALPAACLLALWPGGPVQAHAIESSLERVTALNAAAAAADDMRLESRFSTGEPAQHANVRLMPPSGEPIELGQTDAAGQLLFSLPAATDTNWELQVDAGPGHRDYLDLSDTLPGTAAAGPQPAAGHSGLAQLLSPRSFLLLGLAGAGLLTLYRRR